VNDNKEDIKKAANFVNDNKESLLKAANFVNDNKETIVKAGTTVGNVANNSGVFPNTSKAKPSSGAGLFG